jgi:hypothetical protein
MTGKAFICLTVLTTLLVGLSCAKLPEKPAKEDGTVVLVELAHQDAIPADWGEAFAVSSDANNPNWLQLWFRAEDGTVRMASYNLRTNILEDDAVIFQRR